jgi:16S rRNA (adenine1518-N6/adenine1519-N6)-dimethyltransferase
VHLSRLVATAFSQRRKTIRNALRKDVDEEDLIAVNIDPGTRPETVPISAYIHLSNRLSRRENASTD